MRMSVFPAPRRVRVGRPKRLKFRGGGIALTALLISALALTFSAGVQAQDPTNTYADPRPCGPGADEAFQPEPHEITSGHFALFDAYWQVTEDKTSSNGGAGVLHTNMCPPKVSVTTKTVFGKTTTEITQSASGIDVNEAIFHILDGHKATVVTAAENPDNEGSEISTLEYPKLATYKQAGQQVWWLRLDDPDTDDVDEQSDLSVGFSTLRFDGDDWDIPEAENISEDDKTFRYRFELERYPTLSDEEHPHFLVYEAPLATGTPQKPIWDSAEAGLGELHMEPGKFQDLQWIFTKAGTYQISVHLLGYVRSSAPTGQEDTWQRISQNETETSEVRTYVFQVGDTLAEVEPPMFGVVRSVAENSGGGTAVGDPIRLFGAEVDTIQYSLDGEGADHFTISPMSDKNAAQIVVAHGANLDYETESSYNLVLGVTDTIDHESNPDTSLDHTLAVLIEIVDEPELTLSISDSEPTFGDTLTWTANLASLPEGATNVVYHWAVAYVTDGNTNATPFWLDESVLTGSQLDWTASRSSFPPGSSLHTKARVSASYTDANGATRHTPRVESDWVEWQH